MDLPLVCPERSGLYAKQFFAGSWNGRKGWLYQCCRVYKQFLVRNRIGSATAIRGNVHIFQRLESTDVCAFAGISCVKEKSPIRDFFVARKVYCRKKESMLWWIHGNRDRFGWPPILTKDWRWCYEYLWSVDDRTYIWLIFDSTPLLYRQEKIKRLPVIELWTV